VLFTRAYFHSFKHRFVGKQVKNTSHEDVSFTVKVEHIFPENSPCVACTSESVINNFVLNSNCWLHLLSKHVFGTAFLLA